MPHLNLTQENVCHMAAKLFLHTGMSPAPAPAPGANCSFFFSCLISVVLSKCHPVWPPSPCFLWDCTLLTFGLVFFHQSTPCSDLASGSWQALSRCLSTKEAEVRETGIGSARRWGASPNHAQLPTPCAHIRFESFVTLTLAHW